MGARGAWITPPPGVVISPVLEVLVVEIVRVDLEDGDRNIIII